MINNLNNPNIPSSSPNSSYASNPKYNSNPNPTQAASVSSRIVIPGPNNNNSGSTFENVILSYRFDENSPFFFDDFLDTMTSLQGDLKRDYDVIRYEDEICQKIQSTLRGLESMVLKKAKPKGKSQAHGNKGNYSNMMEYFQESSLPSDIIRSSVSNLQDISSNRKQLLQRQYEKCTIIDRISNDIENHLSLVDSLLTKYEVELRESGDFVEVGAKPGDFLAFRSKGEDGEETFLLGQCHSYDKETDVYKVADADPDSEEGKIAVEVSSRDIVLLHEDSQEAKKLYQRGEKVWAVYPGTTCFYKAAITLINVKKQHPALASANFPENTIIFMVKFEDDVDETGGTPDRPVSVLHVFKRDDFEE